MRCKKHATDLSTTVGVCASCLRERLLTLIAAQEQAEAQLLANKHCNSDANPAFPRSVSPYITRRKSDNSVAPDARPPPLNKHRLHHSLSDQRFYSSPQIAISTGGCIGATSASNRKKSLIRFSSFSNLFRSSNGNGDSDSNSSSREPYGGAGQPTSVTSSPARFSNVLPGRGGGGNHKKKSSDVDEKTSSAIAAASGGGGVRRQRFHRNRGMSPVRSFDDGGEDEYTDGSSEYEPVESCKQTPRRTPAHSTVRRGGVGGQRSVSEMIFCLSPLVRASPNRLWSHKGKPPVDGGGDGRIPVVPHLSNTKSFCANRSRKLADFGRSDPNR